MTLTKFEAELLLRGDERHESYRRRLKSMLMAATRFREWGKNKNAGIHGALMAALYEIDERFRMAHYGSMAHPENDDRLGQHYRAELGHYYPIIHRMYDVFAMSRLLEPSEVTESTMDSALREANQRERDNPVMVWAHDEGCTVDHTPNGPKSRRKNCPTPKEWDD